MRLLLLAHLVGLGLGLGCASAKLALLAACTRDHRLVPAFVATSRPITRLIILGLALLTLSGAGLLLIGYEITALLVVKLVLVGAIWILGPVIDNIAEPKFKRLAPGPGEGPSAGFVRAGRQYLLLEAAATGLFYAVVVLWVLG